MEMVKLTGKSGNVTTHSPKHVLLTHIISQCIKTFQNGFNVRFMAPF